MNASFGSWPTDTSFRRGEWPVLITTVCPACATRYQVASSLQGVTIRCPNSSCGRPFVVKEAGQESNGPGPVNGGVGDMVPLVPAEEAAGAEPRKDTGVHVEEVLPVFDAEVAEAQPPKSSESASWKDAPPVRRGPDAERPPGKSRPPSGERPSRKSDGPRVPVSKP